MDLLKMLADLREERSRIEEAITASNVWPWDMASAAGVLQPG